MNKLVTPILAEVEFVTGEKQGQYGLYRSVLFLTQVGEKIWKSFDPNSPELEQLTPRTKVRLIPSGTSPSGKPSHVIELLEAPATAVPPSEVDPRTATIEIAPTNQARTGGLDLGKKRAIAAYVEEQASLYAFCHSQAAEKLGEVPPETVRCAASSLYIAAQRKFGL